MCFSEWAILKVTGNSQLWVRMGSKLKTRSRQSLWLMMWSTLMMRSWLMICPAMHSLHVGHFVPPAQAPHKQVRDRLALPACARKCSDVTRGHRWTSDAQTLAFKISVEPGRTTVGSGPHRRTSWWRDPGWWWDPHKTLQCVQCMIHSYFIHEQCNESNPLF